MGTQMDYGGAGARAANPLNNVNRAGNLGPGRPFASGLDLKSVAEVLVEEGLDPTRVIADLLKGTPDPDDPEKRNYLIEPKTRLHFCNELLKYIHPQKKAVEMEAKVNLRGKDLDSKLHQLMRRYAVDIVANLPDEIIEETIMARENGEFDPWSMV